MRTVAKVTWRPQGRGAVSITRLPLVVGESSWSLMTSKCNKKGLNAPSENSCKLNKSAMGGGRVKMVKSYDQIKFFAAFPIVITM